MHDDCFNYCRINSVLSYTCMSYESLFYLKIINSLFWLNQNLIFQMLKAVFNSFSWKFGTTLPSQNTSTFLESQPSVSTSKISHSDSNRKYSDGLVEHNTSLKRVATNELNPNESLSHLYIFEDRKKGHLWEIETHVDLY